MTDVHLVWFSVPDAITTADRDEVRRAAAECGLPEEIQIRDSKVHAFMKACRKTRTTYTEDDGRELTLYGEQVKRTGEFITVHVLNDDGLKLAEYKFFQSRRTRVGVVKGSHVVRSVLRQNLSVLQRRAAQEWLATADAAYEQYGATTPMHTIRRITREGMHLRGIPVLGREAMYFVYDDEIEVAEGLRRFLGRTLLTPSPVMVLGIDDFSDYSAVALSADAQLGDQMDELNDRIDRGLGRPVTVSNARRELWHSKLAYVRRMAARHERRLRHELVRTGEALRLADEMIAQLPVHPACRQ